MTSVVLVRVAGRCLFFFGPTYVQNVVTLLPVPLNNHAVLINILSWRDFRYYDYRAISSFEIIIICCWGGCAVG